MTRERKKRKRRERRLHKENILLSALQKICDEMSRKYYNRLNSLLRREEAARKKLIVEEPRTQRKVSVVLVHRYLREILNVGYELI